MRKWSILFIKSDFKWCIHLSRFQLLSECHCWWTRESPKAHLVKLYGQLRFDSLRFESIKILWVNYTIPCGSTVLWYHLGITFQHFNYFVWLRIPDEGSVPEMGKWSILLIKFDLKWCIHLSRSLFLYLTCTLKLMTPRFDIEFLPSCIVRCTCR